MTEEEEKQIKNSALEALYQGPDAFSPYPLSISSPQIKPIDKRLTKANALETMRYQADQQINILKQQAELLMLQAREIEERVKVSDEIYRADLNFEPVIGTIYYLYEKNAKTILSLISPIEWGKIPYDNFRCAVKLLADKSWEVQMPL